MSFGFIKALIQAPTTIGAVWPSSPFLAKAMVKTSAVDKASSVIELGPGTGAFTGHILESLSDGAHFTAIEKCADLARTVSQKFPHARVIEGCATELQNHLECENIPRPDAILSGLPWAVFGQDLQTSILKQIHSVLEKDGVFSTFAYYGPHRLEAGRRFRTNLEGIFGNIQRTPVILQNFPPAFIYYCRR